MSGIKDVVEKRMAMEVAKKAYMAAIAKMVDSDDANAEEVLSTQKKYHAAQSEYEVVEGVTVEETVAAVVGGVVKVAGFLGFMGKVGLAYAKEVCPISVKIAKK